ncbi:MAG: NAD(P)/FAD-dependent oxidoreductase [Spartobacteria bacterium]
MKQKSVAVIGAGMAGVGAARFLVDAGWQVVVFDKSRGLGGRCATKRWEGHSVDHGAQYFTMRDGYFSQAVRSACGGDLLEIEAPIVDETGRELAGEGRFFHAKGNSRLARALAESLDVRTGMTIEVVENRCVGGEQFDFILSTAPWPQTAKLAGIPSAQNPYAPCLAGLFLYEGVRLGSTAARYAISDHSGHALAWSACENHKPGRVGEGFTVMVVHASEEFSRERLEDDPASWAEDLRGLVEERWDIPSSAFRAVHPHRWRYARISQKMELPALPEGWHFAGDLLTESRVESAWLAGREVAARILSGA